MITWHRSLAIAGLGLASIGVTACVSPGSGAVETPSTLVLGHLDGGSRLGGEALGGGAGGEGSSLLAAADESTDAPGAASSAEEDSNFWFWTGIGAGVVTVAVVVVAVVVVVNENEEGETILPSPSLGRIDF